MKEIISKELFFQLMASLSDIEKLDNITQISNEDFAYIYNGATYQISIYKLIQKMKEYILSRYFSFNLSIRRDGKVELFTFKNYGNTRFSHMTCQHQTEFEAFLKVSTWMLENKD